MAEERAEDLDVALLRALRHSPSSRLDELAGAVGLPRSNFGRPLASRVREPVERLVAEGLVEERGGRYRLSERGRRRLADAAFDGLL
jgi:DNA-binding IclR family transcriptional regulator